MRIWLKRLIYVLVIAIIVTILWDHKDKVGLLSNNNLRIEGDWYRVEMNFKDPDVYRFSDRLIYRNGEDWGAYDLRMNTKLEVTTGGRVIDYHLEFEDDDNMVWYLEVDGKRVPSLRWRR